MNTTSSSGMDDDREMGPRDATYAGAGSSSTQGTGQQDGAFDWERLAFTALFAVIAWFTFWIVLGLSLIAFCQGAFGVRLQADFGSWARRGASYLSNIFAYISGAKVEKPFPFGSREQ